MFENELREHLKRVGASIVGFADLSEVDTSAFNNMKYGISFGYKLNPEIIGNINKGPTKEYFDEYTRVNKILDDIVMECVKFINGKGYNAVGQTTTFVTSNDNMISVLPHKTVATRAGLGWIGKDALLITPEYGSAVRISSVITDMPLETDKPINQSKCSVCTNCLDACPAEAIKGKLWDIKTNREELVDVFKCRQKARELSKEGFGVEITICGKCIEVCPYTKRYLRTSKSI